MSWVHKATAPEVALMVVKAKGKLDDLSKALNAMVEAGKITQQEISILNDEIWEANNMMDAAALYLQEHSETGHYPIGSD